MELEYVHLDYQINEELAAKFDKLYELGNAVTIAYRKAESKIVEKVLTDLLKREITNDDAKDCEMIIHDTNTSTLYYKGVPLGFIKKNFGASNNILDVPTPVSISFVPQRKFILT
jgi:hypothetical protein